MDILIGFIEKQGMVYIMLFLFLCGFLLKTVCSLCYDEVIDKIDYLQLKSNKVAGEIIRNYEKDLKIGKNIKNTEVYVKSELHKWKKFGIIVEKMSSIGDGFGKMCIVFGVLVDIFLLSVPHAKELLGKNYMNKIYIYCALSIMLMLVLKMWSNFLAIDYKKNLIKDEIINYIDNHPNYVKLLAESQQTQYSNADNIQFSELNWNLNQNTNNPNTTNQNINNQNINNQESDFLKEYLRKEREAEESDIKASGKNNLKMKKTNGILEENKIQYSETRSNCDKDLLISEVLDEFLS